MHSAFIVFVDYAGFSLQVVTGLFRRPFYVKEFVYELDRVGVGSLLLSIGIGLFLGMVLPVHLIAFLPPGTSQQLPQLMGSLTFREVGPALTAVILAGRLSSGMAAELASMKATEQLETLRMMGVDIFKTLVTTKVVACLIMLPLLIFLVDIVAILGSWLVAGLPLGVTPHYYINAAVSQLTHLDMGLAVTKAIAFGFIIATVACFCGLRTRGGTVGIARSSTQGVVAAGIVILMLDVVLSNIFTPLRG